MRNVREKLAKGQTLDEDDVRYAVDRGIALPEKYGEQVRTFQLEASNLGTPPNDMGKVFQGGPAFPSADQTESMGPGLFLDEGTLGTLTGDTLDAIAEAVGVDVPRKKSGKVEALIGATVSEGSDEEDLEPTTEPEG